MSFKKTTRSLTLRSKFIISLIFIPTIIYWLVTSGQAIVDFYAFRQAQTAISSEYLFENGVNFINYQTPVLGKPWSIPFEFPIYQAIVKIISSSTNQFLAQTGRITNSASILFSALICISMLSLNRIKELYIIIFSALVATSYTYMYYGRSFLIDGTALLFTTLTTFFYIKLRANDNYEDNGIFSQRIFSGLGLVFIFGTCLSLGMLTKATTTLPLIGFIAIDQIFLNLKMLFKQTYNPKILISGLLFAVTSIISIVVTKAWIDHADYLKSLNINANFIISKNLTAWNYGSLNERLEPQHWLTIFSGTEQLTARILLPLLITSSVLIANYLSSIHKNSKFQRKIYLANLGFFMYVSSPLIFFNLYLVHEYYSLANLIFGYLSLSASLNLIVDHAKNKYLQKSCKIIIISITALICIIQLNFFSIKYFESSFTKSNHELKISEHIKNNSLKTDRLVTARCDDWSSQLFYLSGLKGLALRYPEGKDRKTVKKEIKKMIDTNNQSIFIIENNEDKPERTPLVYLSPTARQKCNFIYQSGKYKAYQCDPKFI